MKLAPLDTLDNPEAGECAWYGVKMQFEPHQVPVGYACQAINTRFNRGIPEPRRGVTFLPWMNKSVAGVLNPWGTVYGRGAFRDPLTRFRYSLVAADGQVYYTSTGNGAATLTLPAGVTITDTCRFVQCFNVVLLLRGTALPTLQMRNIPEGFTSITQTDDGTGTFPIPNALRGLNASNRLFLIQDDTVLASDLNDYTRFSIFKEMLVNQGAEDRLVTIGMFGPSTMICLKEKSIYRVDNVRGDLSQTILTRVTERYGCVAADTAVDMGTDFIWLSQDGVASLTLTQQNEVQAGQGAEAGKWPMFSDDIKPLIKRINWSYVSGACAAFNDGKYYLAVPLDSAEGVGPELAPAGYSGATILTGLVVGATYRYVKGSEPSLTCGSTVLTASADFTALAITATLAGGTQVVNTGASCRRVRKGVNNAVLVFDTQSASGGAWAGHDEGAQISVAQFFTDTYLGKERLFFRDPDGYVKLYEEGFEDQVSASGHVPIVQTFLSREYGLPDQRLQSYRRLFLDVQTWNPCFTADLLGSGVNQTLNLCSDRTKDRSKYYRPFDAPDYVTSNTNDDSETAHRQDYSLVIPPAPQSPPTPGVVDGFYLQSGIVLDHHQESREPFHFAFRGRSAQVRLVNTTGRLRLICLRFTGKHMQEKGTVLA